MKYTRPAYWDDVCYVSDNMRPEDIEECEAGGLNHFDALRLSFERSDVAYTLITPDDVPCAILGVSPSPLQGMGIIWMLGTDGIRKHKITFLRNSLPGLQRLYDETGYEALYNYTYAKNKLHHAWLRWLGFKFIREVPMPPYDQPFYEFVRLKG